MLTADSNCFFLQSRLWYDVVGAFSRDSTTDCRITDKCVAGNGNVTRTNYAVGPINCVGVVSAFAPDKKGQYAVLSSARTRREDKGHYCKFGASACLLVVSVSNRISGIKKLTFLFA